MPISKEQKKQVVSDLKDRIARAKSAVFTTFFGVDANGINALREQVRQTGSEYVVAKKTLIDRAFAESDISGVTARELTGEVAVVFGYDDEVAPAKTISEFAKTHESVKMLGGVLESRFIDAAQVSELAQLPGKQELYARLVGSMNAPVYGFVNALAGNMRNLVYVLKAIEEKKA